MCTRSEAAKGHDEMSEMVFVILIKFDVRSLFTEKHPPLRCICCNNIEYGANCVKETRVGPTCARLVSRMYYFAGQPRVNWAVAGSINCKYYELLIAL